MKKKVMIFAVLFLLVVVFSFTACDFIGDKGGGPKKPGVTDEEMLIGDWASAFVNIPNNIDWTLSLNIEKNPGITFNILDNNTLEPLDLGVEAVIVIDDDADTISITTDEIFISTSFGVFMELQAGFPLFLPGFTFDTPITDISPFWDNANLAIGNFVGAPPITWSYVVTNTDLTVTFTKPDTTQQIIIFIRQ